ncbi:brain-specific serine protease 4-like isoform X2 [Alosa sapidissima]|nr:brain-specific serine protease 4-like isoform X2 [Alosa sapidissima]
MVHLEVSYRRNYTEEYGGSLVSDQWVMTTAGWWTEDVDLERSFAHVGELSLKEPSGRLVRLKWVLHPEYRNNRGISNNIALVQLQEAVCFSDTVKPVVLPSPRDQFSEDTECWLTGWGHITLGWPLGGKQTLQEVQVSLFDDATCRQIYPWMTDRELCAGDRKGLKGACMGDSGAPLVCVLGEVERRFVQVGLVSHWHCARDLVGKPDVYTRVLHHTQFIRDTIQEAECSDLPPFEACFL